ncbi:MAG TPA: hypothetical protein VIT64_05635 [Ilumatobacteraceae bacterium]
MTLSTLDEVDPHDPFESRELRHLEAQLIARFSPPLRPEEVHACLVGCVARYESARVRQYLPVLIERDARQRLGDLSRARMIGVVK